MQTYPDFHALSLPSSSFIFSSCSPLLAVKPLRLGRSCWAPASCCSRPRSCFQGMVLQQGGVGLQAANQTRSCDAPESTTHSCCCCCCRGSLPTATTHTGEGGQGATPHQARSDTCMAVLTPSCARVNTSHLSKALWTSAFPTKIELGLLLLYLRVSDNGCMFRSSELCPIQHVNFSLRSKGINLATGNRRSHSLSLGLHLASRLQSHKSSALTGILLIWKGNDQI